MTGTVESFHSLSADGRRPALNQSDDIGELAKELGVHRRLLYAWSLCSFCAQLHLIPTHSGLFQPKFDFRILARLGLNESEWAGVGS